MKRILQVILIVTVLVMAHSALADVLDWDCPVYQRHNGTAFCTGCGTKYTEWECVTCKAIHPFTDTYCGDCGTKYDAVIYQSDDAWTPSVNQGLEALQVFWANEYASNSIYEGHAPYLEVMHTRWINILDLQPTAEGASAHNKYFASIDYIIEFMSLTNYYLSDPYYQHYGINECYVVYKDGTTAIERTSPIRRYISATYDSDLTDNIEVIDFGSKFNGVYMR